MARRASLPNMNPTIVAALIAVAGTVVVAVTGFLTTRNVTGKTLKEQRTQTLNERFATAASQLGGDKPPAVQLAGVYAMAVLADDWEENRQTCVDVLCGYLRMPYEPDPGEGAKAEKRLAFRASREVRHTVIRVITAHLKDGAAVSWQGLNFDFSGVVFDGGDFNGAVFSGDTVNFGNAKFSSGMINFGDAEFSGQTAYFGGAEFSGGTVSFWGAKFSKGEVWFNKAAFSDGEVWFNSAAFSGAKVDFTSAQFTGSRVDFGDAEFCGSTVSFSAAWFPSTFAVLMVLSRAQASRCQVWLAE
jgi:Pentapeptide repeats (9 copies)